MRTLVEGSAEAGRSLIGSVAVDASDLVTVVDGGVRVNWFSAKSSNPGRGADLGEYAHSGPRLREVDVLTGRGTSIPVAAFRELGLYDERTLPHYAADYEFSRRAARHGYKLFVDTSAVVPSHTGSTGLNTRASRLEWTDFGRMFVARNSSASLPYRWKYAVKAVPGRYLVPYMIADTVRVIAGNLRNQMRRRGESA